MRILHISDPHIFCPDDIRPADLFGKRGLGLFNWYMKRRRSVDYRALEVLLQTIGALSPDVVCITGDVVHLGQEKEFEMAAEWLGRLERQAPVKLVPGNHDLYVPEAQRYLERYLGRYFSLGGQDGSGKGFGSISFPAVDVVEDVAIIGLSSAYPCSLTKADGRLGHHQLMGLSSSLERFSDKGLARVLLVHHPPLAGLVEKRKELRDAGELEMIVRAKGAEMTLFGHTHRRYVGKEKAGEGNLLILCAPSITSMKPALYERAGFHFIDLAGRGRAFEARVSVFVLSEDGTSFFMTERFDVPVGRPGPL